MHKVTPQSDSFFDAYLPQAEEFTLSNGNVIQIKKLSYGESMDISNKSISGIDSEGNPEINFEAAQKSKYEKISRSMVEPKMTVKQLLNLSDEADDILEEIFEIVDPKTAESIREAKEKADKE